MTLWVVKGGRHGQQEDRFLEHSVVGVGWDDMPDLGAIPSRDQLKAAYAQTYPQDSVGRRSNVSGQLWAFAHEMQPGDLVVTPLKTRSQIAVGRVSGAYQHTDNLGPDLRHTRPVKWIRTDFPRTAFDQDLLYSFGSFMTVCTVRRNNAEARVAAVAKGQPLAEPNPFIHGLAIDELPEPESLADRDLEQDARDQITDLIRRRFKGHGLARIVDAILRTQGLATRVSPPGPDGGVDIVASGGAMGFDHPRIAVQVKSSDGPAGADILRALKGTMSDYNAEQGLLVSWGGFKSTLHAEARTGYFRIRLWDQGDLMDAVFANYDRLDDDLKAELPLKRIWTIAREAQVED
jgi:restriction system protein